MSDSINALFAWMDTYYIVASEDSATLAVVMPSASLSQAMTVKLEKALHDGPLSALHFAGHRYEVTCTAFSLIALLATRLGLLMVKHLKVGK